MVNPGPAGPSHQADVAHLTDKSTVEGLFSGCELISRPKMLLVAQLHSLQAKLPSLARRSGPVFQTKHSGHKKTSSWNNIDYLKNVPTLPNGNKTSSKMMFL